MGASRRATRPRLAEPDGAARTTAPSACGCASCPTAPRFACPSGTPVFDAASWNGIAIDSTCGGYGTCKKCKVRIVSGEVPIADVDPRAFTADELADGWRLACRAAARDGPGRRGAAAADAPEGGARRRRAPRDPAPVGAEAPPRARGADAGGSALGPRSACSTRSRTSSRSRRSSCCGRSAGTLRRRALRRHRGGRRRGADRRRAGRHDRAPLRDRVRPRHDDRRRDAARPRHRAAARGRARCSTASSRSART